MALSVFAGGESAPGLRLVAIPDWRTAELRNILACRFQAQPGSPLDWVL